VWEQQGYDVELIKANCKDTRVCSVVGLTYRLDIDKGTAGQRNEQSRTSDILMKTASTVRGEGSCKGGEIVEKPPKKSKEEKQAEKQAAKEAQQIEKEAAKHLSAAQKAHGQISVVYDMMEVYFGAGSGDVDLQLVGQWAIDAFGQLEAAKKYAEDTIESEGKTAFPFDAKEVEAIHKDAVGANKMVQRLCKSGKSPNVESPGGDNEGIE